MSSVSKPPAKSAPRPTVSVLIVRAVSGSGERSGVSLVALKRALQTGGYDVERNRARILSSLRRLVENGSLSQTKGSFRGPPAAPPKAGGEQKDKAGPCGSRAKKVTSKKAPVKASSVGMGSPAGKRRRTKKAKKAKKSPAAGSKKPRRPSNGTSRRLTRSMDAAK